MAQVGTEHFDELATLREIERVTRVFIFGYYQPHTAQHDRPFAPGTVRFADEVTALLEHLDAHRAGVGVMTESNTDAALSDAP